MSSSTGKQPGGKGRAAAAAAGRGHATALSEARRARDRRRRLLLSVGAPVVAVVLVVATFLIIKANQSPSPTGSAAAPAGTALVTSLEAIPAATFDAVGVGTGAGRPTPVTGAALSADGKPRVLYIGAEYCPFCAAQRWAVVTALSRFGTFSNLGVTRSAAKDSYPNTATLSFHGATYTSDLLAFTGVETTTNIPDPASGGYTRLDPLSSADQQIDDKYNKDGSIPFVDFGNAFVIAGASYDPAVLQGLNQSQIVAQLADPNSAVAKQTLGAANMMTAVLCTLTKNQPSAVCGSTAVTSQKLTG